MSALGLYVIMSVNNTNIWTNNSEVHKLLENLYNERDSLCHVCDKKLVCIQSLWEPSTACTQVIIQNTNGFLIQRRHSTKIFLRAHQEHPLPNNRQRRTSLFPWFSWQLRSQSTNVTNNGHFQTLKNLGGSVTTTVLVWFTTPLSFLLRNPPCCVPDEEQSCQLFWEKKLKMFFNGTFIYGQKSPRGCDPIFCPLTWVLWLTIKFFV